MVFNFNDILNRHRHKMNAQGKDNVFTLVKYINTNPLKKLKGRGEAHR